MRKQLAEILGPLPPHLFAVVRRLPDSLPQYEIGHLERIGELESLARAYRGLHLIGNAYHGVGVSDLIRAGRGCLRDSRAGLTIFAFSGELVDPAGLRKRPPQIQRPSLSG